MRFVGAGASQKTSGQPRNGAVDGQNSEQEESRSDLQLFLFAADTGPEFRFGYD